MSSPKQIIDFIKDKKVVFVQTKERYTTEQMVQNIQVYLFSDSNFILEDDFKNPEVISFLQQYKAEGKSYRICPICRKSFPGVLSQMTAFDAGIWATNKCKAENWDFTFDNIESCLANLEMDF